MDDVPNQAGPSVIADEASSGSKARTAAMAPHVSVGPRQPRRIAGKTAQTLWSSGGRRRPLVARPGVVQDPRPAPTLQRAEINLPAQKTAGQSHAQKAEVDVMHAAQSLNTNEVSARTGETESRGGEGRSKPWHRRGRGQDQPLTAETHGEACQRKRQDRSNWIEDRGDARCRSSRRSLCIRNAGAKTGQEARHDAFDPSQHPNAPGAPRPLGTIRSTAPANKGSADYAYWQPAH